MAPVESPCIKNCCLDDNDICVGCFRSLAEITRWSTAGDDVKARIMDHVQARRVQKFKECTELKRER